MRGSRILRAAGLVLAAWPATALAQNVPCADTAGGEPIVYGTGGAAQRDLIGRASAVLQSADDPVHAVFQDGESCAGIYALTGIAPPTITGTAYYWDDAGTKLTCDLSLTGDTVDFASSINLADSCGLVTDPAILDPLTRVTTPVSAVSVVVDADSTQQAISAEAFYLVYGLGPAAGLSPWTNADPAYYVNRDDNAASKIILSLATGLPISKFYGVDAGSSNNVVLNINALADPEASLGFIPTDIADANRATVRTLAWQGLGQNAAYWPDSTATSFDKRNVRDGQYELWSPGYLYAYQGAAEGSYADPDVQKLADYLSGVSQPAGTTQTMTQTTIANKNIPPCAMHVIRTTDMGPIYASEPATSCDCLFDFSTTGATSCDSCDDTHPCSTGVCRDGFCEAR